MFSFFNEGDDYICNIYIKLGHTIVQNVQVPFVFAKSVFIETIVKLQNDTRPIEVRCIFEYYTDSGVKLEPFISFRNNTYLKEFGEEIT